MLTEAVARRYSAKKAFLKVSQNSIVSIELEQHFQTTDSSIKI